MGDDEKDKKPLEVEPDPTPVIGFREWLLYPDGSLGARFPRPGTPPWRPGINVAECHGKTPLRPDCHHHHCGFWGYYRAEQLRSSVPWALERLKDGNVETAYVLAGAIQGFGVVVEHEKGFRAERAQIIAFLDPQETNHNMTMPELINEVLHLRGWTAPFVSRERLEIVAGEFGDLIAP
jgi:hypothetical protein